LSLLLRENSPSRRVVAIGVVVGVVIGVVTSPTFRGAPAKLVPGTRGTLY
jgi:hypothetical protein